MVKKTIQAEHKSIARPPVVVVMGHIDHGKSTLLDYIRKTNIVAGEAGGITQRLSAYEVEHTTKEGPVKKITFLDTPGHEAFQSMRSRGAGVADVAILVVSAEDGVKAQTKEALKTILESGIPYIVAINKIDKPNADIERTKRELVENEIYVEGYGGTIPAVPISAKAGTGIEELLDVTLLAAELEELTGTPEKPASGIVIEAHVDTTKGISATLVIKDGTLEAGQFVVAGNAFAPVRIMENFLGKNIKEATFSSPVRVIGFSATPAVGSIFTTVATKKEAEELVRESGQSTSPSHLAEEDEERVTIPVVIKADALGAVDAIEHELQKTENDRMRVRVIQRGVGTITEGDAKLASGSPHSIIIGFNVSVDARAKELAERAGILIETFDIIYKIADWFAEAAKERTPKMNMNEALGRVKVLKIFSSARNVTLFGGRVESGRISEKDIVRILRDDVEIGRGHILSLQQGKSSAKNVEQGSEFGAQLESEITPQNGDTIEPFIVVEK